jgi:hypothetical protein
MKTEDVKGKQEHYERLLLAEALGQLVAVLGDTASRTQGEREVSGNAWAASTGCTGRRVRCGCAGDHRARAFLDELKTELGMRSRK